MGKHYRNSDFCLVGRAVRRRCFGCASLKGCKAQRVGPQRQARIPQLASGGGTWQDSLWLPLLPHPLSLGRQLTCKLQWQGFVTGWIGKWATFVAGHLCGMALHSCVHCAKIWIIPLPVFTLPCFLFFLFKTLPKTETHFRTPATCGHLLQPHGQSWVGMSLLNSLPKCRP